MNEGICQSLLGKKMVTDYVCRFLTSKFKWHLFAEILKCSKIPHSLHNILLSLANGTKTLSL